MLRFAAFLSLLISALAFAAPIPKEKPKEVDPFLGKWKMLAVEVAGRATGKVSEDSGATIDKEKITFTGIAKEPDDVWTYKLDPAKKEIDLGHGGKPGMVNTFKGIYDLKDDALTIVFEVDPKGARPTLIKSGPTVAIFTLQRIKDVKAQEEKK